VQTLLVVVKQELLDELGKFAELRKRRRPKVVEKAVIMIRFDMVDREKESAFGNSRRSV
jgi:hypothetical protein